MSSSHFSLRQVERLPTQPGVRPPLGPHRAGEELTLTVFSRRASQVRLELFERAFGQDAVKSFWLERLEGGDCFSIRLRGVPNHTYYGFRCFGPNWGYDPDWIPGSELGFVADFDRDGNRFNPNKLLFDPYARELSHDRDSMELSAAQHTVWVFATGPTLVEGVPARLVDTGRFAPKGLLIDDLTPTGKRPYHAPERAIIYEGHVRGMTQHPSASDLGRIVRGFEGFGQVVSIPERLRGTYAGVAFLAPYLRALGISTLELLPVHHFEAGREGESKPLSNFWGYMTLGYFAPNRRYAADRSPGGPTREFKSMVRSLHDAGIEVYLDVVYNHTGEAGNWLDRADTTGFVSLGGFDAAEYYLFTESGLIVEGATGCGNQLNCSSPAAQALVLDSLTYWLDEMGVDGFRFDLAPVLGRTPNAFERTAWESQKRFFPDHPLLVAIRDLGRSRQAEMIAEAWDLWGYEVGNFPSEWGEWNGRYRDAARRFLRGEGNARELAEMMDGDVTHFADNGGASRCVDFVDAHDGFTMLDLVSYASKQNAQPYPFGPTDGGTDDNLSSDSGGDHARRRQQLRNIWTLLAFSRGLPMVVYGDELGRTQNGNNNPWCLDSVATWTNYRMIATNRPTSLATEGGGAYHDNFGAAASERGRNPLFVFAHFVLSCRRSSPLLGRATHDDQGRTLPELPYRFTREDGHSPLQPQNRCLCLEIDGRDRALGRLLLLINGFVEQVRFRVPTDGRFRRIIDTAAWAEPADNCWPLSRAELIEASYQVWPQSMVVLEECSR